jgi:hypothetical protein
MRWSTILLAASIYACGSSSESVFDPNKNGDGGGGGDGSTPPVLFGDAGGDARPCVGLECQVKQCANGGSTTLTGKVLDPSGRLGIYNVIVYVPNKPVEPFKQGVACDQCGAVSGSPVVSTLTDAKGEFRLEKVPSVPDLPVVIQIGKWRKQFKISTVNDCTDNPVPNTLTRLPGKKADGDMPQMVITTGSADSLECFLRKLGIDDSEFTGPTGNGKVHYYRGNGTQLAGGSPDAETLWSNPAELAKYDITLLSCEGSERRGNKDAHMQNILDYVNKGGKVFSSHFHYVWFRYGPQPLPTTATYGGVSTQNPYKIDTSFPKGNAFADWLVHNGASATKGSINLSAVRDSVGAYNPAVSTQWIYDDQPASSKYFSFNTPIGKKPEEQCGRAVFTDVHVSGNGSTSGTFPGFCTSNDFNDNEKALLFLFFDLSSCIQDEKEPPKPPPPR